MALSAASLARVLPANRSTELAGVGWLSVCQWPVGASFRCLEMQRENMIC
jgi:hypothetical protein